MKPTITIEFRLDPWKEPRSIAFHVDEFLLSKASEAIDFPSLAALDATSMADRMIVHHVCTPPEEIARRLKFREEVANLLRSRITGAIYDYLERGDKEMGYPKHPSAQQQEKDGG